MTDVHDRDDVPSSGTDGDIAQLRDWLLTILRSNPAGISEYDLFAALHASGDNRFDISKLRDTFALFCAHFRLFNALYRLREQLWSQQLGVLEISPLRIILHPYASGSDAQNQFGEVDALRDYYLDDTQLEQTTPQALDAMLDKFWRRLSGVERRRQALEVLGLRDPAGAVLSQETIKREYRRLVMAHHPDRGGETQQLQVINAAMAILNE